NLSKLADYLLSGKLKAEFDMNWFDAGDDSAPHLHDCGTCGCAVGHGPYAGITKESGESWLDYCLRVFGVDGGEGWFETLPSPEWDWLFNAYWAEIDNTPEGAGLRIRWLLE